MPETMLNDAEAAATSPPSAPAPGISILRYPDGRVAVPDGSGRFRVTIESTNPAALDGRSVENLVDAEILASFGRYSIADQTSAYPVNPDGTDWNPVDPSTGRMRPRPADLKFRRDWIIRAL